MNTGTLSRLSAFTKTPEGGNPAGVWVGDQLPSSEEMQRIAAEVGFSETAFIAPSVGRSRIIRYFSPEIEIPFCGHATIASGVVLGESTGDGVYQLETKIGKIPVQVESTDGYKQASLTSIDTKFKLASDDLLDRVLSALDWCRDDIDVSIPPAVAHAGNWHLVLAVSTKERLDNLAYEFENLKAIMQANDLVTLQLIWRESDACFHSRNPFPIGGVVEDPATGSAAASLGGYLRDAGLITVPKTITLKQGEVMGRPSKLTVHIPDQGGIVISGTAVHL